MATKEKAPKSKSQLRPITGETAIQIVKYANKFLHYNLASPQDRQKYFDAIKALRELSDIYCEINGIDLV